MARVDLRLRWRDRGPVVMEGTLHPGFIPVATALRRQLEGYPGGAAVCVYHRGQCVVDLWGGTRDRAGNPWEADTLAPSFSTTKGVASTLLHIMADRGLLRYEDRIARYWPEFAQAGKDAITVRHVLTHQSGLYHIRQMIDRAERMLDWEYMIRAIERTSPLHQPGARSGYHGLTYGFLVGELLQRVTGRPFSQLVQDEIAQPLGLDGLYIGAPDDVLPRAAELISPPPGLLARYGPQVGDTLEGAAAVWRRLLAVFGVDLDLGSILDALAPRGISSFDFGADETLRVAIPAANGLFTARSLARMYAALACSGEIDGVRLLSRETLRRATQVQSPAPRRAVLPIDMRWRLGYHAVFTTQGIPAQAFGHFGFGGSGAWADPSQQLALGMIVNSGVGTPFGDLRIARISGAALLSVRQRTQASGVRSVPSPRLVGRSGARTLAARRRASTLSAQSAGIGGA
ncbi:MAG TPA: serine hydrolase domain-containing protein [Candidatus Margulisiibacteriota bacterium]|nr:serine hydrolase domain-containing protein [Candidatus Margulisiibacteriota bacterium]